MMKKQRAGSQIQKSIRLRAQQTGDRKRRIKDQHKLVDSPIPVDNEGNYQCQMVVFKVTDNFTCYKRKDAALKGRQILREMKLLTDLLPDNAEEITVTIQFRGTR